MKNFVTLFPQTMNFHLTKDVGMIPYVLGSSELDYKTELVTYYIDDYFYLDKEVKGLQLTELKRITGSELIDSLLYIWKNAKNIDVLHLFHWGRKSYFRIMVYKLRNPKGIVFDKLDISENGLNVLKTNCRANKIFRRILSKADIVSAESTKMQKNLSELFGTKIAYYPNGFYYYSNVGITQKENIVLTVGRIGAEEKATKELVEGFLQFWQTHQDWRLILVGPVDVKFQEWYDKKYEIEIADEREKQDYIVQVVGEVSDKEKLAEYYKRSSVFALPSRWESFGLVLVEAMSYGCSLLTTKNVVAAKDILNDNCVMIPTERETDIADGLVTLVDRIGISEQTVQQNIEYVQERFSWDVLAQRLDAMINEIN